MLAPQMATMLQKPVGTLEDNNLMYKKQSIPTHPLVMLEVPSGSFNCNADRLLRDSLEQGAL